MVSSEGQEERELDKLLLLLSQPLTRLILSVLAGVDPGLHADKVLDDSVHSDDSFMEDSLD